ncbi:Serine/threonine-protein phosphatase 2A activator 1 [Dichotomopilus funicola]|uniref:Serine/threonine-protein phosphatase 2A activator n=1 Tax=Dichotomopilus funicola TaxID=1934379 RepID=A0AAN6ZNP5_9PEZI|nr:Serine/threonine-protein phosphatase 2A activator 1 [Dichotomopilus funicola]
MDPPPPPSTHSSTTPVPPPPSTTTATSTTSTASTSTTTPSFPRLAVLAPSKTHTFSPPQKRIHTGADLPHFLTSLAYRDIGIFILQLNRALCPRKPSSLPTSTSTSTSTATATAPAVKATPQPQTFPLNAPRSDPPSVLWLRDMLDQVAGLIDQAPPEKGPRRFGNVSFRRWYTLLEEKVEAGLLRGVLEGVDLGAWGGSLGAEEAGGGIKGEGDTKGGDGMLRGEGILEEVKGYFLGAFGSAQRLDYGTGHELSFLAFLGALWKVGVFRDGKGEGGEVERSVVLGVFEPYLKVVRRLILTYNLEPAGSHGVWGLDDHTFLPYIFGSAQLTRPITETEPMPLEGSVPGAPRPSDVAKAATVDLHRDSNMYFSAIGFINDVKTGPFWEHSPILFDISGIKDGWGKINKGMIKMFNAEVLSKFPVVQHFPFGSLFSWDPDPEAALPARTAHVASQPGNVNTATATPGEGAGTAAPWAQATKMPGSAAGVPSGPGIPYSRAPWAAGGSAAPSAPRGVVPETGPPPPTAFPRGKPGTASNQFAVTKAPWAKD